MRFLKSLLSRWADRATLADYEHSTERLERENASLRLELTEARSRLRIQELELDELSAVIARNIKRVEAETAAAAARIVAEQ